jgi:hypothetical protein
MTDRAKVIHGLELVKEDISEKFTSGSQISIDCLRIDKAIALLKEQEAEIRQLRLALDIAKGTCKGIAIETDEKFMGDL